jgi:hypothetical protein
VYDDLAGTLDGRIGSLPPCCAALVAKWRSAIEAHGRLHFRPTPHLGKLANGAVALGDFVSDLAACLSSYQPPEGKSAGYLTQGSGV